VKLPDFSRTPPARSRIMSSVRGKNTEPEMIVRRVVHAAGYRYRLHARELPGKPDLVFPRLKKAVFVHGCFWHAHNCRHGRLRPVTNASFWKEKLGSNKARDRRNRQALRRLGWRVLIVWECQLHDLQKLRSRLVEFLRDL